MINRKCQGLRNVYTIQKSKAVDIFFKILLKGSNLGIFLPDRDTFLSNELSIIALDILEPGFFMYALGFFGMYSCHMPCL